GHDRHRLGIVLSNGGVAAVEVAADPHHAAARLARSVQRGGHQVDALGEQIDVTANGSRGLVPAAAEQGARRPPIEPHAAASPGAAVGGGHRWASILVRTGKCDLHHTAAGTPIGADVPAVQYVAGADVDLSAEHAVGAHLPAV